MARTITVVFGGEVCRPREPVDLPANSAIFTARRFDAAEALACGLVNAVYPPEELLPAALALAERIAGMHAGAVRAAKRVIEAATLWAGAVRLEEAANRELRGSPEQTARFRAATRRVIGR
jgi:enoyl-CoA hydratase/carnithine racemase